MLLFVHNHTCEVVHGEGMGQSKSKDFMGLGLDIAV